MINTYDVKCLKVIFIAPRVGYPKGTSSVYCIDLTALEYPKGISSVYFVDLTAPLPVIS